MQQPPPSSFMQVKSTYPKCDEYQFSPKDPDEEWTTLPPKKRKQSLKSLPIFVTFWLLLTSFQNQVATGSNVYQAVLYTGPSSTTDNESWNNYCPGCPKSEDVSRISGGSGIDRSQKHFPIRQMVPHWCFSCTATMYPFFCVITIYHTFW